MDFAFTALTLACSRGLAELVEVMLGLGRIVALYHVIMHSLIPDSLTYSVSLFSEATMRLHPR